MWTPAKDLKRHQVANFEVLKKRNNNNFNKANGTNLLKPQPIQAFQSDNPNEVIYF